MTHVSVNQCGINARFGKNKQNQPSIDFSDPCYVRAEHILFEPRTRAAHAVLHEGIFLIGHVPSELEESFSAYDEIQLTAHHYAGNLVSLQAPIIFTKQ